MTSSIESCESGESHRNESVKACSGGGGNHQYIISAISQRHLASMSAWPSVIGTGGDKK